MDPLTEKLWQKFLAADAAEDLDKRCTPADLTREMLHDKAANAMDALREMGYLVFHVDEQITGTIVASSGEYVLAKIEGDEHGRHGQFS